MTGPHPQSKIATDNLTLRYGPLTVIPDLTMRIRQGAITSLVGRNGCGKSTLLRCLGRLLPASGGSVLLDGKSIAGFAPKELARQMAMLPQGPTAPDGMTVQDLVEKGRYPHRGALGSNTAHDRERVTWALRQTGMSDLADRPLERLSGGQRQRAWIAMALAQDTSLILLDEPTTFLDVAYQLELMELLRRLNREHGTTILMVLHDLNQAAAFSDTLIALREGTIYAVGTPHEVLTVHMVRDVFGLTADVIADPRSGIPLCLPYALAGPQTDDAAADDRPGAVQPA
jgi:iron complex transport system ATP-binding protein